jgi:hypothetical protein
MGALALLSTTSPELSLTRECDLVNEACAVRGLLRFALSNASDEDAKGALTHRGFRECGGGVTAAAVRAARA